MPKVFVLPDHIASQIAAGEVVERPASVVKELVENSLDAGATQIEIAIGADCRDIRIADNGCGMEPEDAVLAFHRHATSKLASADDLWNLRTMGFRGEALPSVSSIAKITCLTRNASAASGTKVLSADGQISTSETGCAPGTVMEVTDLFYNVPARLKFLKKASTEFAHILEIVQALAIAFPACSFQLINQGEVVFRTTGSGNLAKAIMETGFFSGKEELYPVDYSESKHGISIHGFLAKPLHFRGDRKCIMSIVNNRPVRCHLAYKALDYAFQDLIPKGRHPLAVLAMTIDPGQVDINVHPTKKEIKYSSGNDVYTTLQRAVVGALRQTREEQAQFASRGSMSAPAVLGAGWKPALPGSELSYTGDLQDLPNPVVGNENLSALGREAGEPPALPGSGLRYTESLALAPDAGEPAARSGRTAAYGEIAYGNNNPESIDRGNNSPASFDRSFNSDPQDVPNAAFSNEGSDSGTIVRESEYRDYNVVQQSINGIAFSRQKSFAPPSAVSHSKIDGGPYVDDGPYLDSPVASDQLDASWLMHSGTNAEPQSHSYELPAHWRFLGYLNNTYILLETKDGLEIVEQHIAHERVLYERLLASQNTPGRIADSSQRLVISAPLNLSAEQKETVENNLSKLQVIGFDFEFNADSSVVCTQVPLELAHKDYATTVQSVIESLSITDSAELELEATKSVACQAAIKNGMKLSENDIIQLLSEWADTPATIPAHTVDQSASN